MYAFSSEGANTSRQPAIQATDVPCHFITHPLSEMTAITNYPKKPLIFLARSASKFTTFLSCLMSAATLWDPAGHPVSHHHKERMMTLALGVVDEDLTLSIPASPLHPAWGIPGAEARQILTGLAFKTGFFCLRTVCRNLDWLEVNI